MTHAPRPEDLLREMRTTVIPVESADRIETRRDSTVARLRELQIRSSTRREVELSIRKRVLVAALVLLSSAGALAATARIWDPYFGKAGAPPVAPLFDEAGPGQPVGAVNVRGVKDAGPVVAPALHGDVRRNGLGVRARSATKKSTLAAENALMQNALIEARGGRDARAVALLDALIARYPASPLRQNAEVERFRALERLGELRQASSEARRYLAEQPSGMDVNEARRLAVPAAQGAPQR